MPEPTASRRRTGSVLMLIGAVATTYGVATFTGNGIHVAPCLYGSAGVLVLVVGLVVHALERLEE